MSTLSDLIARVALELGDAAHAVWSTDALTLHIRRALEAVSRVEPQRLDATIACAEGVREYPLAGLGAFYEITDLWHPYDASQPGHPPERPAWALILSKTFYLGVADAPTAEQSARLFYTAPHTIEDLDGATETTLDAELEGLVALGAAGCALEERSQAVIGAVTVSPDTPGQYAAWAAARMRAFQEALQAVRRRRVVALDARVPLEAAV